jgi:hypothetical protein
MKVTFALIVFSVYTHALSAKASMNRSIMSKVKAATALVCALFLDDKEARKHTLLAVHNKPQGGRGRTTADLFANFANFISFKDKEPELSAQIDAFMTGKGRKAKDKRTCFL